MRRLLLVSTFLSLIPLSATIADPITPGIPRNMINKPGGVAGIDPSSGKVLPAYLPVAQGAVASTSVNAPNGVAGTDANNTISAQTVIANNATVALALSTFYGTRIYAQAEGLVCDGSTNTSAQTTAWSNIASAINASKGAEVVFPAGHCKQPAQIAVTLTQSARFEMARGGTSFDFTTSGNDGFKITVGGSAHITWSGGQITTVTPSTTPVNDGLAFYAQDTGSGLPHNNAGQLVVADVVIGQGFAANIHVRNFSFPIVEGARLTPSPGYGWTALYPSPNYMSTTATASKAAGSTTIPVASIAPFVNGMTVRDQATGAVGVITAAPSGSSLTVSATTGAINNGDAIVVDDPQQSIISTSGMAIAGVSSGTTGILLEGTVAQSGQNDYVLNAQAYGNNIVDGTSQIDVYNNQGLALYGNNLFNGVYGIRDICQSSYYSGACEGGIIFGNYTYDDTDIYLHQIDGYIITSSFMWLQGLSSSGPAGGNAAILIRNGLGGTVSGISYQFPFGGSGTGAQKAWAEFIANDVAKTAPHVISGFSIYSPGGATWLGNDANTAGVFGSGISGPTNALPGGTINAILDATQTINAPQGANVYFGNQMPYADMQKDAKNNDYMSNGLTMGNSVNSSFLKMFMAGNVDFSVQQETNNGNAADVSFTGSLFGTGNPGGYSNFNFNGSGSLGQGLNVASCAGLPGSGTGGASFYYGCQSGEGSFVNNASGGFRFYVNGQSGSGNSYYANIDPNGTSFELPFTLFNGTTSLFSVTSSGATINLGVQVNSLNSLGTISLASDQPIQFADTNSGKSLSLALNTSGVLTGTATGGDGVFDMTVGNLTVAGPIVAGAPSSLQTTTTGVTFTPNDCGRTYRYQQTANATYLIPPLPTNCVIRVAQLSTGTVTITNGTGNTNESLKTTTSGTNTFMTILQDSPATYMIQ